MYISKENNVQIQPFEVIYEDTIIENKNNSSDTN